MPDPFRLVGRRTLATGGFLRLDRLHLATPEGAVARVSVQHPGAVAVVPLDGTDVVLIRQYRAPVGAPLLEIPAGKLDGHGESLVAAARRELAEEVGFVAAELVHAVTIHTTPGFTNEQIAIFIASGLTAVPAAPVGAEERASEVVSLPLADALEAVRRGEITDAKTIVGLYAATAAS